MSHDAKTVNHIWLYKSIEQTLKDQFCQSCGTLQNSSKGLNCKMLKENLTKTLSKPLTPFSSLLRYHYIMCCAHFSNILTEIHFRTPKCNQIYMYVSHEKRRKTANEIVYFYQILDSKCK